MVIVIVPALYIVGHSRRGRLVWCILDISSESVRHSGIFWLAADFAFVILHTACYILAKSVRTAGIVGSFEHSLGHRLDKMMDEQCQLGLVHTYTGIFKNVAFCMPSGLSSTCKLHFRSTTYQTIFSEISDMDNRVKRSVWETMKSSSQFAHAHCCFV